MRSYLDELFGLSGKVAVVTGGGRGIGQVAALGLAKAGADIVILVRGDYSETVRMIEAAGGKAYGIHCDVTKEDEVDSAFLEIERRSGRVDIVFNNAGVCLHKGTFDASIAEWQNVLDINLTGEYIVARAAAKLMVKLGIKGSIINMGSISASIVNIPQWQASYNASKAGVVHLSRSLAMEWIPYGIRVNCLSPGYIATPMADDVPEELKKAWEPLFPMHRMGKPEELLPAILYLASDASSYTTGTDTVVDGAYTCI